MEIYHAADGKYKPLPNGTKPSPSVKNDIAINEAAAKTNGKQKHFLNVQCTLFYICIHHDNDGQVNDMYKMFEAIIECLHSDPNFYSSHLYETG